MDVMGVVALFAERISVLESKFRTGQVEGFGYAGRFAMSVLFVRRGVLMTMFCHETCHTFVVMMMGHNTDDQHDKGGQAYEEYGELFSHKRCGFGTKIRVSSYIKCFFDRFPS